MKNKIFEKMREYGWNLEDNSNEDFEKVYNMHYNFIQGLYDYFVETDEPNNSSRDLNNINEQKLYDMISFISDFLRALNDIDYNTNTNIKLGLISHYVKNRNISSEQVGQDILAIIENDEEKLEELKENNSKQINYIEEKTSVCGFDKSDMYELGCLNYENKQIDKLLEEIGIIST